MVAQPDFQRGPVPQQSILVADDDALLVGLLTHRLSAKGYAVSSAGDGAAAIDAVREQRPDLIVLDAMMPVMDGFEALRRIKSDPDLSETPVVMLTALRQEVDVVGALELGAEDYLIKPFMPEELLSRIGRILKKDSRP
jgi:DNA-binding response OmpR family regulator